MALLQVVVYAQNIQSAVTLKNGTILQGFVKYIDPTKEVKMIVAGIETTINLSDVAKIESIENSIDKETTDSISENEKLRVTDNNSFPESFDINVGNNKIKMILVRGGDLNMGYDGRHSLKYKSEPVHKVKVTSFYMSEEYITRSIASTLIPKIKIKKDPYYSDEEYDYLNEIAVSIAKHTNIPVRIPTEAEWEYAACSEKQSVLFDKCKDYEFCSDWFGVFEKYDGLKDPTGPSKGKRHVYRSYSKFSSKYDRSSLKEQKKMYFRIVVKAKDVAF